MEIARCEVPTIESISGKLEATDRKMTRLVALCQAVLHAAIDLPGNSPAIAHVQTLAELTRDTADATSSSFADLVAVCEARIAALYSKRRPV